MSITAPSLLPRYHFHTTGNLRQTAPSDQHYEALEGSIVHSYVSYMSYTEYWNIYCYLGSHHAAAIHPYLHHMEDTIENCYEIVFN